MHEYGFDLNEDSKKEVEIGGNMLKIKKAPMADLK